VTYIHSDKVRYLVELNQSAAIRKKKAFREDLRGCSGKTFNSPDERMQSFTVQDGVDIVKYMAKVVDGKDDDGNEISHMEEREREEPHMHTFQSLIHFHQGVLNVGTGSSDWSAGFDISFVYRDGKNATPYTLPRTGLAWNTSGETWSKSGLEIGVTKLFDRTPTINKLLAENVANNWEQGREDWKAKCRAYRGSLDAGEYLLFYIFILL